MVTEKIILFLGISWVIIMSGFLANRLLVLSTGFYYWPTLGLIAYLILLCLGLKEQKFILPILLFLVFPLALFLDTILGSAAFGYYAIGFLLGNLFFLSSLSFTNINNQPTQLIDILIFLIAFWIIGPVCFIKFINPTVFNYNLTNALIHLVTDFVFCFFIIKKIKPYFLKYV